ncbi:MAG: stage III sporulation protein AE, partial [Clostridia bacterium]|nr:stage III sporulation protein AE [Clostridia bacterium]
MKRLIGIIILSTLILSFSFSFAFESAEKTAIDDAISEELEKIDLTALEDLREKTLLNKPVKEMVLDMAEGKSNINPQSALEYLFTMLLQNFKEMLTDAAFILFAVIMCTALKNMAADGLSDISGVCEYVGFMFAVSVLFTSFLNCVAMTKEIVTIMQSFARIIFPPLLTLMIAMGGITSAAVFKPAMAVLSGGMIELLSAFIIHIGIFGGVTGILDGISSKIRLSGISGFCNSLCKWLLGIAFTVYAGILSIQGLMSAAYDGIYIRTAKYTVDSFMPVVGSMMSDTVDTIMGCSLLLKNAIGFTGLIIISCLCLIPLIKYISYILCYKLLGAIMETTTNA